MSCVACDEAQEIAEHPFDDEIGTMLKTMTFIRVGNGNVLISGCKKHLNQLGDTLNMGRAAEGLMKEDKK